MTAVPADAADGVEPVVRVRDLHVAYALRTNAVARLLGRSSGTVRAVDGISFDLAPGEVLGVVGESGSGKSTLGRALLGLAPASAGSITYRGREITGLPEREMRPLRQKLQMVFQDPHASLNPSMTVGTAIADALRMHGVPAAERAATVDRALEQVGLAPARRFAPKYPSELSGGQKQRAVIARAIALQPDVLVADEPISMLDMSVRAKILGLLQELKQELSLTYVYITHDLASARFFCDRIAIMYLGRVVEIGPVAEIFAHPRHPYTQALLRAVPDPDPSRGVARDLPRGEIPDASRPPAGCAFHPRCPAAFDVCGWEARDLRMILEERWTTVDAEQYTREQALVGDVEALGAAATAGRLTLRPAKGTPAELLALLEQTRDASPDEPFWTGVTGLAVTGRDVEVTFADRATPALLPIRAVGGLTKDAADPVSVACHLYRDEQVSAG